MASGTYPTQEFNTYAESQVPGALGSKKKYVIIKVDETQGSKMTLYFFDGETMGLFIPPASSATTPPPVKTEFEAIGGETEIAVIGIQSAGTTVVWQGFEPLREYIAGDDSVPAGYYKIKDDKILIGTPAGAGERFIIIQFS